MKKFPRVSFDKKGFKKRELTKRDSKARNSHFLFRPEFEYSCEDGFDRFHFTCYCADKNKFTLSRDLWFKMCAAPLGTYMPSCGCYHGTPCNVELTF